MKALQQQLGLLKSVLVYYGIPFKIQLLARFYAQFIQKGDLCFDIGAHVGDRLCAWSRLGARIVGVEPQAQCMRLLRRWYGERENIALVEQAVASSSGVGTIFVSERTPTVSSLSQEWIDAVKQSDRFSGAHWETSARVQLTTLDELIDRFGHPAFCKIDVEGYEGEVLDGLSYPVQALSFEYNPVVQDIALGCVDRLERLGDYEFNWTRSEIPRLRSQSWLQPGEMRAVLANMPSSARTGDVYARRMARPGGAQG